MVSEEEEGDDDDDDEGEEEEEIKRKGKAEEQIYASKAENATYTLLFPSTSPNNNSIHQPLKTPIHPSPTLHPFLPIPPY